jgi:AcrR family transcriptional regulator
MIPVVKWNPVKMSVSDPIRSDPLENDFEVDSCRQMRADARRNRERILESARELFAEAGAEAQMDDVARRAGVGVGTVYRHFPTKEALMVELVRQKFRVFAENLRAGLQRNDEPFTILADVLRANAEVCERDAVMQHALSGIGESFWESSRPEQEELAGLTAELVARAQRNGTMRPDVTAQDIPMLMCGVSATMAHSLPNFDWHRHLELVISMLRA